MSIYIYKTVIIIEWYLKFSNKSFTVKVNFFEKSPYFIFIKIIKIYISKPKRFI